MSGNHSISIAVLTNSQDDVERINSTLRGAGHAAHCHWVKRSDKLADVLSDERVELVILNCDSYSDSVRQVVKQKDCFNPEIPVIALREEATEVAIHEAMRSGAVDLVSLGLKKRMLAVISRELRALRAVRALNSTIQSANTYRRQIRDLMQSTRAAIAIVQEGIVIEANEPWLRLFKIASLDEIEGMPLMDLFARDHHAAIKGALVATLGGRWQEGQQLEAKSHLDDGEADALKVGFTRIERDGSPCIQVLIQTPDPASQEPTKLVHGALQRDPSTLFFQRAQFLERVMKRLSKKPSSGQHIMAYVKVDNFKELQKEVGIIKSEDCLVEFAEVLRSRLHPQDIAGRFEGTAVMVLMHRGSPHDVQVWGTQLIKKLKENEVAIGGKSVSMSCTIGISGASPVFSNLEDFVAATVKACRAGVKAGGGKCVVNDFDEANTKQRKLDRVWVKRLKAALMENRFRLAQLPIAGLRTDGLKMYDLLVRMVGEQGESVLPSEFLPAAARNNMMKNIDRWMIKSAIRFCDKTESDRVFVRLSLQSIMDPSTATWIQEEFDKHAFECSRIVLQIPERDAAKQIKQTRALVHKLRKIGIGFALEHYGVDKKQFRILDLLKPDYIKIDGELMHTLMTDSNMQSAVESIVAAARERQIRTIAERVENANAMAVLFQLGLDFMQGHYVHEPEVVLEDRDSGTHETLVELETANLT